MTRFRSNSTSDVQFASNSIGASRDLGDEANPNDPTSPALLPVQIHLYYFSPGLRDHEITALILKYINISVVSIIGLIKVKHDRGGVGKKATFSVMRSEVERIILFFNGMKLSSGKLNAEVVDYQEWKRLSGPFVSKKHQRENSPRSLSPPISPSLSRPLASSSPRPTTSLPQKPTKMFHEPPRTHSPRSFPLFISGLPNLPDVELKKSVINILSEYFVQIGNPDIRSAPNHQSKFLFVLVLSKGSETFDEMQIKLKRTATTVGGNQLQFRAQLRNPELLGRDWDDQEEILLEKEEKEEIECTKIKKAKKEKRAREKQEEEKSARGRKEEGRQRKNKDNSRTKEKSSRSRDEDLDDTHRNIRRKLSPDPFDRVINQTTADSRSSPDPFDTLRHRASTSRSSSPDPFELLAPTLSDPFNSVIISPNDPESLEILSQTISRVPLSKFKAFNRTVPTSISFDYLLDSEARKALTSSFSNEGGEIERLEVYNKFLRSQLKVQDDKFGEGTKDHYFDSLKPICDYGMRNDSFMKVVESMMIFNGEGSSQEGKDGGRN